MAQVQTPHPSCFFMPYAYRYMDKHHIDLFFDKGLLRISSFTKFIRYPDEIRGDRHEGNGVYQAVSNEGLQFNVITNAANTGYIFCTSLVASEQLKTEFQVNSYFKINDVLGFSDAIANAIENCYQPVLGFCNYQQYRIIKKKIEGFSQNDFLDESGNFIITGPKMLQRANQMTGNAVELLFLKENTYQYQSEFRFLWTLNIKTHDMEEHLDITCGEAVKYCERIEQNG